MKLGVSKEAQDDEYVVDVCRDEQCERERDCGEHFLFRGGKQLGINETIRNVENDTEHLARERNPDPYVVQLWRFG
jgi:hypothetical protein